VDIQTALWARRSGVRLLAGTRYVYFLQNFHTGVRPTHPPTQWVKRQRCEAYNSSSTTAKVKNEWRCTSAPPACLHGLERKPAPLTQFEGMRFFFFHVEGKEEDRSVLRNDSVNW